jgi:quercetin dioxygenase-like cupin family protein
MELIDAIATTRVTDRNLLAVNVQQTPEQIYPQSQYTKFIMAYNAILVSDTISTKGCFTLTTKQAITLTKIDSSSRIIVIDNYGFAGLEDRLTVLNNISSPGHLSYIDGCSNTNMIDPARNGDPCINYLHIPAGTDQTFHTHPSVRIILILDGEGSCSLKDNEIPLISGQVYNLPRHTVHRFKTTNKSLSVMVFHPDSEDGPRDENNPMKSRTYIK